MSTRYVYSARLVPVGSPVRIPFLEGGGSKVSTFTADAFDLERTAKTKPPVWINHDPELAIGRVVQLYTDADREWWCAHFMLDRDVPDDVELEVGQPVSVGLTGQVGTYLSEVSVVRHGAVKGAEIIARNVVSVGDEARPTSDPVSSPTVLPVRRIRPAPTVMSAHDENAEYRRRLDWLEQHTGSVDPEAVLAAMQVEREGVPAILRLANWYTRSRAREGVGAR
jgi:hypothetical protein